MSESDQEKITHIPKVEYKVEGDSLFNIDPEKLATALKELGYKDGELYTLKIVENTPYAGQFGRLRKDVQINQDYLVALGNFFYVRALKRLEGQPERTSHDQTLLEKIFNSNWIIRSQEILIHGTLRKKYPDSFFAGNIQRKIKYLQMASEGRLSEDLPPEEQQEHAKKIMASQMERALRRYLARMVVHEYEHGRNYYKELAKMLAMAAVSSATTYLLIHSITPESLVDLLTGFSGFFGVMPGIGLHQRQNEEKSMKAEKAWDKVLSAITVNEDVLKQKVLTSEPYPN